MFLIWLSVGITMTRSTIEFPHLNPTIGLWGRASLGARNHWVALLGRRDQPTDAIEDYCRLLGDALRMRGVEVGLERLRWEQRGWPRVLIDLWRRSVDWKGDW